MKICLQVNNTTTDIEIKQPLISDIPYLQNLNSKWQFRALNGNTEKGFLSGLFDEAFFRTLIKEEAIIAAYSNNKLIAYMLTANNANLNILKTHKEEVEKLKNNLVINKNAKVAIGIQTAVEEDYHGSGLIVAIRNEFRKMMSNKFQYFFTTISKNNQRSFASATKYGWKKVGEDEHHYFLLLTV